MWQKGVYIEPVMKDYTYRLGFIFAVALHVVLVLFLVVKITTSRQVALNSANNFINAVAVNENAINSRAVKVQEAIKPEILPQKTQAPKPQIKDLIKETLQKNLLMEQAKEASELKKERQVYQKNIKKQQQQKIQKMLQEQVIAEQKQLADEQSKMTESVSESSAASGQSQGEVNKYKAMVIQAISSQWNYSGDADEKASGQLLINITPSGEVISVQLSSSSGNLALDRSAQAAVFKASPLPVPENPSLFDALIKMTFTRHGFM